MKFNISRHIIQREEKKKKIIYFHNIFFLLLVSNFLYFYGKLSIAELAFLNNKKHMI